MKKTLLLGSFAIFAMAANAQLWCGATTESLEAAGFVSGEKVSIDGDIVFAEGDGGTIATAYSDSWGISAPCGTYKSVVVGDTEVKLSTGAVGNTNPTFVNYASGVMSAGAVFKIVPEADGWLTVFTKMNPNKQYVVFEGKTGPMAYTLGYSNGDTKIHYTLPYDEYYYIDFYAEDASKYLIAAGGEGPEEVKPQFPWMVAGLESSPSDNTGFLTFNVLGGNEYYFAALGSKCPCGVFVLTEGEEIPTVTYLATDDLPEVSFVGESSETMSGVEALEVAKADENAPVYNVLGQKVSADAKGLLIQNGKKFIRK